MDRGAGVPMDAGQDLWDWEVLPDKRSFSMGHGSMHLNGKNLQISFFKNQKKKNKKGNFSA
jgi:hypothetical protein